MNSLDVLKIITTQHWQ